MPFIQGLYSLIGVWMRCGLAQVNGVKNLNKSKRWTRCHSHERWHWLRQTEALLVRPRHSTVCWVMSMNHPAATKHLNSHRIATGQPGYLRRLPGTLL